MAKGQEGYEETGEQLSADEARKAGNVSASEAQLAHARAEDKASEAPSAGGSGLTTEQLDAMSKDELVAEAERRGLTVTRGDGGDGEPTKQDYYDALSK